MMVLRGHLLVLLVHFLWRRVLQRIMAGFVVSAQAYGLYRLSLSSPVAWTTLFSDTCYKVSAIPALNTFIAGASGNLYRSIDGGNTWGDITAALPSNGLYYDPVYDGTYLWEPHGSYSSGGLSRSSDGGNTWTPISSTGASNGIDVCVNSLNPQQIAFIDEANTLYLSGDGGITWMSSALPVGFNSSRLIDLKDGTFLAIDYSGAGTLLIQNY